MSEEVVIVAALRTPIGAFNGSLAKVPAHDLAAEVIKELLNTTQVSPDDVSDVILGQVLGAGQGQNPSRQAALGAGLPHGTTAMGINMVCGSGLRAVAVGAAQVRSGEEALVVAGGMENMSQAVHVVNMRTGVKFGPATMEDSMIKDGLTDAFNKYHMGVTAENVAKLYGLTREEQDSFAVESQKKAGAAMKAGCFKDEVVKVSVKERKTTVVVEEDEFPKPGTSMDTLAKLRPAFATDGSGTVTAGNASGLNDGAAAVLLMSGEEAARRGLQPLARIVSSATAGVDPAVMGTGPVPAVRKALARAGWTKDEVDMWELNEAFAAQSLAVVRDLAVDKEKVNVSGGAIALGHPIGASGARVLVTLIHGLRRAGGGKGVAALCIGGGMGIAMCVEVARHIVSSQI